MTFLWCIIITIQGESANAPEPGGEGALEQAHIPPGDKTREIDGGRKQQIMQKYCNNHKSFIPSSPVIGP